jgi:xanthine/CO dehydrogenase XdhC/CoxF family maturation factor
MKEIKDIVKAFDAATRQGKKTALATVVHVEGSSYRRPGARMLVTEDGKLTGAISGGCLEGDALHKAVLAIAQEKNKLVVYDTTDEDDAKLGIQLGCNGIVSILFEPIDHQAVSNPINLLKAVIAHNKPAVLLTGYSLNNMQHYGTCSAENLPLLICQELSEISKKVFTNCHSTHAVLPIDNNRQQFFFEYCQPPVCLVIVGAGNDAVPLTSMASILGWTVTIVDGRMSHATAQRFPMAEKILVGKPHDAITQLATNERTAVVLMTHNYNYDIAMLRLLMVMPLPYIGILGPISKRNRMFNELEQEGLSIQMETCKECMAQLALTWVLKHPKK